MSSNKRKIDRKADGVSKKMTPESVKSSGGVALNRFNPSPAVHQSKISAPSPARTAVEEEPLKYKVKELYAATAKTIIAKHGDIMDNCLFSGNLRVTLLESACEIFEKLKNMKFSVVTLAELDSVIKDVDDLERAQVEVSWLLRRLKDIYEAKQCAERSPQIEEQRNKNLLTVEKLRKELSLEVEKISAIKSKLEEEKAQDAILRRTYQQAKEKVFDFRWKVSENGNRSSDGKFKYPTAEGCKLKDEFESAAQVIFSKQGDILADHIFQGSLRLPVLESACFIYLKLAKLNLSVITLTELEALQRDVCDLERAKVDVSWVSTGLKDIIEAKKLVEDPSFMEESIKKHQQNIEELEKDLDLHEGSFIWIKEKLDAETAETEILRQNFLDSKEKVSRFFRKSLIDGL